MTIKKDKSESAKMASRGDPKTLKADETARQEWQKLEPTYESLLVAKAERKAQILKFKGEQGQDGLVSLDAALGWLQECNRDLLIERIGKLWAALSEETSVFKIGGALLPSVTIVQDDYSPPISEFTAKDLADACLTKKTDLAPASPRKMYDDPLLLRELLKRLWLPQRPLNKLFQHNNWPSPPWLTATGVSSVEATAKTSKNKSGAGRGARSIQSAFNELFPSGSIPVEMSSQDRNDLIKAKLKDRGLTVEPTDRTIQRALKKL